MQGGEEVEGLEPETVHIKDREEEEPYPRK